MDKLPLSLCIFVKNEEKTLADCVESVIPIVSEIVIVDTGSTDNTFKLAKKFTDRAYSIPFTDFGSIRTITAHLSNRDWVLMLDADERILPKDHDKFAALCDIEMGTAASKYELDADDNVVVDSYALPRKRWADSWMSKQVDKESYPDWQVRLFRNHIMRPKIRFVRRVHERVQGCIKTLHLDDGPVIHHFQNVNKNKEALAARQEMYTRFRELDIAEGIEHEAPAVIEEDRVK